MRETLLLGNKCSFIWGLKSDPNKIEIILLTWRQFAWLISFNHQRLNVEHLISKILYYCQFGIQIPNPLIGNGLGIGIRIKRD
jgi:hypothetical protein